MGCRVKAHHFEDGVSSDTIERGSRVSEFTRFSIRLTSVPLYDLKSGIYT